MQSSVSPGCGLQGCLSKCGDHHPGGRFPAPDLSLGLGGVGWAPPKPKAQGKGQMGHFLF
eukprot:2575887-Amphidinium_carterae.1